MVMSLYGRGGSGKWCFCIIIGRERHVTMLLLHFQQRQLWPVTMACNNVIVCGRGNSGMQELYYWQRHLLYVKILVLVVAEV